MKTRKALEILSKGERVYEDRLSSNVQDGGKRFLEMFEERERQIMAKQSELSVPLPFLESIKRKVASIVSTPNTTMPVVTRFDLYTGIRKLANRAPNDNGLKRLTAQLERAWHADPLGSLNYGEVSGLVGLYKDQYPRSKAADAIEAECSRVGMHKLPVAKLARIASKIETQTDYDTAMEANGYGGDRPEQIRARALVRELVAMRGSAVDAHEQTKDQRDIGERVAGRVAQMMEPGEGELALDKEPGLAPKMPGVDEHAEPAAPSPEMADGDVQPQDVEQGVDLVKQIDDMAQEVVQEAPPEAADYIQHEMAEGHSAPPGTAEWGAEEILNEGHEAPPPTDQWLQEEMEEMGMGEPKMASSPLKVVKVLNFSPRVVEYSDGSIVEFNGDLEEATLTRPDGTKERLVWLDERDPYWLADLEYQENEVPAMPPKKSAKGKGIPLPDGEIDEQPNAKNALDVPDDGGKALKAKKIEEAILDGYTVKVGSAAIRINDDMEVELWNKNAGRVCDLTNMDVAIADFINMVDHDRRTAAAKLVKFSYAIMPLVHVPCEACAELTVFPLSKNANDEYACTCGNLIKAASVAELMKVADMGRAYQVQVAWTPPQDPQQARMQRDRIMRQLQASNPNLKIDDEGRGYVTATVWNADDHMIAKIEQHMKAMGGQAESRRVAELIRIAQKWRTDPKWKGRTNIDPVQSKPEAIYDAIKPDVSVKPGEMAVALKPIKDSQGNVVLQEGEAFKVGDIGDSDVTIEKDVDVSPMDQLKSALPSKDQLKSALPIVDKLKSLVTEKEVPKPAPRSAPSRNVSKPKKVDVPADAKKTKKKDTEQSEKVMDTELVKGKGGEGKDTGKSDKQVKKDDKSSTPGKKTVKIPKSELANVRPTSTGLSMDDSLAKNPSSYSDKMDKMRNKLDKADKKVKIPGKMITRQYDDPSNYVHDVEDDQVEDLTPYFDEDPAEKAAQLQTPPAMPAPGGSQLQAPAAPPAQTGGDDDEQPVTDMPIQEVIKGAFVNYKAQGMSLPEALRTFFKEHADLVEQRWSPDADAALVAMQTQYYTANSPAMPSPAAIPPAGPEQGGQPTMPMMAQKVLEPSVSKKMTDLVSVGKKPLGKDSQGDDLLPSPGKIKQQQDKPSGKLSPTDLGSDSDSKDVTLAKPSKTEPTRGKLPNKDMGSDSEGNEPFPMPGQGAKLSVKKASGSGKCDICGKQSDKLSATNICPDCWGKPNQSSGK